MTGLHQNLLIMNEVI